jgi:hypothetical protein
MFDFLGSALVESATTQESYRSRVVAARQTACTREENRRFFFGLHYAYSCCSLSMQSAHLYQSLAHYLFTTFFY